MCAWAVARSLCHQAAASRCQTIAALQSGVRVTKEHNRAQLSSVKPLSDIRFPLWNASALTLTTRLPQVLTQALRKLISHCHAAALLFRFGLETAILNAIAAERGAPLTDILSAPSTASAGVLVNALVSPLPLPGPEPSEADVALATEAAVAQAMAAVRQGYTCIKIKVARR